MQSPPDRIIMGPGGAALRVFEPATHQNGKATNGATIGKAGPAVSNLPGTAYTPEPVRWLFGWLAGTRQAPPAGWCPWRRENDGGGSPWRQS